MYFKPWIGAEYARTRDWRLAVLSGSSSTDQGTGFPVHVMGESHYGEQNENAPDNTLRIMDRCAFAPSACSGYFTKLAHLFVDVGGVDFGVGFRREVWDRLAFSNYVQEVLPHAGVAPSREQIAVAEAAFFDQLRLSVPTILLVVSHRLWGNLPVSNCVATGAVPSFGQAAAVIPESRVYTYWVGDAYCWTHAICIPHPRTSAFRRQECAAKLLNALLAQGDIQDRFCSFDEAREMLPPRRYGPV